jgi:hypothetical protein
MPEFVVDGLVADRESVFELTVGGVDGRLLPEHDTSHEIDQGREEQFVGVLASGVLREQMVDVLRVEEALAVRRGWLSFRKEYCSVRCPDTLSGGLLSGE